MPLFNVIDERTNEFNPRCDVVFEVFADDWTDFELPRTTEDFTEWLDNRSVYDAVSYAQRFAGKVTLFLYDPEKIVREHGFFSSFHPRLKKHPMNPSGYDPKLLRNL